MEGNFNNLFNYKIVYSKNRKMTVGFKINDDTLTVISPKRVPKEFLMELIDKRKYWAIERIQKRKQRRSFINDNKILFLGKEIELSIKENSLLKDGGYCELSNNGLTVNISKNWSEELLENTIKNWYRNECQKIIEERVLYYSKKYSLSYGKITIKEQKTVWGTCNFKNNLTFNWKVMMFEPDVVDYLVVHELVHTIYKNHSAEYWKKVESILPNYRELNNSLKNPKVS